MKKLLVSGFVFFLSACATVPTFKARLDMADTLAARQGWHRIMIPADSFKLTAYVPSTHKPDGKLTVYIEGDGYAWISASQPSSNPSPNNPIGLKLALADTEGNAAYLARPCQYIDAETSVCPQRYWTQQRFAPEVIAAQSLALDTLKTRFHATELTLVGYSGGGAVAALLAARRSDVKRLITVAGNLDHAAWTRHHRVEPLTGSLNPANERDALKGVRQWHFVGGRDKVIPPVLVESFANQFPEAQRPNVIVEPVFGHDCCWAEDWPQLIRQLR